MVTKVQAGVECPAVVGRVLRHVTCTDANVWLTDCAASVSAVVVAAIAPTFLRVPGTQFWLHWSKVRVLVRIIEGLDVRIIREVMVADTDRYTILIRAGHVAV